MYQVLCYSSFNGDIICLTIMFYVCGPFIGDFICLTVMFYVCGPCNNKCFYYQFFWMLLSAHFEADSFVHLDLLDW